MKSERRRPVTTILIDNSNEQEVPISSVDILAGKGSLALVTAAQRGNREAFQILVERHEKKIFFCALRITRNRQDAEDVVQQSFQKAFTHLNQFEGKSSFSTWLTSVANNEALMLLRKSRGSREIPIEDGSGNEETALDLEIPDSGPGPEDSYSQSERKRVLSAAMNQLTPGVRKAIELRELRELSTEETARVMGLTVQAVKGRVFHGRKKLRGILRRIVESTWMSRKQTLRASSSTKGISRERFAFNAGD
jgi:RNA polymerase sigma-70 factor (ECF subfamily)